VIICPELAFADGHQILSLALAKYLRSELQFEETSRLYGHFF
jgi:hypothetical protein